MKALSKFGLAVIAMPSLLARSALAQSAEEIARRAAETVAELKLQTELPLKPEDEGWDLNLPAINFSTGMLWTVLIIALAIVLYAIRDELPRLRFGRTGKWTKTGEPTAEPSVSLSVAAIGADDLARAGRYVEAMHTLLLSAIGVIRGRLGDDFADSLTSREILRRANLPSEGRSSLRDLITRVEISYFGAYPAAHQDYLACRRDFEIFLHALMGEAAA